MGGGGAPAALCVGGIGGLGYGRIQDVEPAGSLCAAFLRLMYIQVYTIGDKSIYLYVHIHKKVTKMTSTTRVFRSGNSQSVRIPRDLAFEREDMEYTIERIGDEIRIRPAPRRLSNLAEKFHAFDADFMADREDENDQDREGL